MARTIAQIYNNIINEKESLASLDGLTPSLETYTNLMNAVGSASKVAEWRLWAYITAVVIWAHENLWDLFKAEVDERANAAIVGSLPWYVKKAKEYEPGVALILKDSRWQYDAPNADNRIVTQASASASDGVVFIKVAKDATGGGFEALTAPELTALESYIRDIGFAGTRFNVSSLNGDTLEIDANIYYDGALGSSAIEASVFEAIEAYLANLKFDGSLRKIEIIDAIQSVDGVRDVVVTKLQGKNGADTVNIDRVYETKAGYITLDQGNSGLAMIAETNQ